MITTNKQGNVEDHQHGNKFISRKAQEQFTSQDIPKCSTQEQYYL